MRVLIDEDTAVQLLEPLRRILIDHEIPQASSIAWKGKKDRNVFPDAKNAGYHVLITKDRGQLSDPRECDAIKKSRLHHVRYEQRINGARGLALALGAHRSHAHGHAGAGDASGQRLEGSLASIRAPGAASSSQIRSEIPHRCTGPAEMLPRSPVTRWPGFRLKVHRNPGELGGPAGETESAVRPRPKPATAPQNRQCLVPLRTLGEHGGHKRERSRSQHRRPDALDCACADQPRLVLSQATGDERQPRTLRRPSRKRLYGRFGLAIRPPKRRKPPKVKTYASTSRDRFADEK